MNKNHAVILYDKGHEYLYINYTHLPAHAESEGWRLAAS